MFRSKVLEDWIYLYYLNTIKNLFIKRSFLRIEFICIIWTRWGVIIHTTCSWGLNLFVLFEQKVSRNLHKVSSWGLNLFVLFEPSIPMISGPTVLEDWIYLYYLNWPLCNIHCFHVLEDWIYLYYLNPNAIKDIIDDVLEDWIYLYYLNHTFSRYTSTGFLRIEFICIIWTLENGWSIVNRSWGLNLFVLFELIKNCNCNIIVLEDWIYLYYLNITLL